MANARLIYRDFFSSPDLTDLPWWGQLMFAGMIVYADDAGVIRADPSYLRNLILGCTNERRRPTLSRVREVLGLLEGRGCITRARMMSVADTSTARNVYVADTQGGPEEHTTKHDRAVTCFKITNFSAFQRLKRREGKRREDDDEAIARQASAIAPSSTSPNGQRDTLQETPSGRPLIASQSDLVEWYVKNTDLSSRNALRVVRRLQPTAEGLAAWLAVRGTIPEHYWKHRVGRYRSPQDFAAYEDRVRLGKEQAAREAAIRGVHKGPSELDREQAVSEAMTRKAKAVLEGNAKADAEAVEPPSEIKSGKWKRKVSQ